MRLAQNPKEFKNFSKIFLSVIFRKTEWLSRFNQSSISVPPENIRKVFFDLFRGCRNGMLEWNRSWHFNSMLLSYTPLTQRFSGICRVFREGTLTFSWRRPLSYRNQSIDLGSKSMDWFLYDNGIRHERVKLKWFKSGL